jgi:hypothetical protein
LQVRPLTCILLHKYCICPSIAVNRTLDAHEATRKQPLVPDFLTPPDTLNRVLIEYSPSQFSHCGNRTSPSLLSRSGAASRAAGTSGDQGLSHSVDRGALSTSNAAVSTQTRTESPHVVRVVFSGSSKSRASALLDTQSPGQGAAGPITNPSTQFLVASLPKATVRANDSQVSKQAAIPIWDPLP